MNEEQVRQALRRSVEEVALPPGTAQEALRTAVRSRTRRALAGAAAASTAVAACAAGVLVLTASESDRLETAGGVGGPPEHLLVLLPSKMDSRQDGVAPLVPLPVPGLDRCLALPGVRVEQARDVAQPLTVEGTAAGRKAIRACLSGLDGVRVLTSSGPEHVPAGRADGLTPAQASRPGADAAQRCAGPELQGLTGAPETSGLQVVAGYLTDTAGYEQWEYEYGGSYRIGPSESSFGEGLVVLCWFRGEVAPDGSVGDPPDRRYRYALLTVQVSGQTGMRLDQRSMEPIPVLPPAPPPGTPADALVVHPQPDGVAVRPDPAPLRR